jgi:hypothetical protein
MSFIVKKYKITVKEKDHNAYCTIFNDSSFQSLAAHLAKCRGTRVDNRCTRLQGVTSQMAVLSSIDIAQNLKPRIRHVSLAQCV